MSGETPPIPVSEQVKSIPGLIEGRVVHYIVPLRDDVTQVRHVVGQIVRVWNKTNGMVNIKLNYDGTNDKDLWTWPQDWVTSVLYDQTAAKPNTWHFIEPT